MPRCDKSLTIMVIIKDKQPVLSGPEERHRETGVSGRLSFSNMILMFKRCGLATKRPRSKTWV